MTRKRSRPNAPPLPKTAPPMESAPVPTPDANPPEQQLELEDFLSNIQPPPPTDVAAAVHTRFQFGAEPLPPPKGFEAPPLQTAPEIQTTPKIAAAPDPLQTRDPGRAALIGGYDRPRDILPMPNAPADASNIRYESRINVVNAYRFDGRVAEAPPWIDRSGACYKDGAPALRIENPDNEHQPTIVRVGDYILVQDIIIDDPTQPDGKRVLKGKTGVMSGAEFNSLYRAYIPKGE